MIMTHIRYSVKAEYAAQNKANISRVMEELRALRRTDIRYSVFLNASLLSALFFLAQFLQAAQGYGPLGAGLRLLPWTATLFIVAPIAGSLVNRIGERPLIAGGLLLQAVGMAWIGLMASPDLAYINLVAPLILAGCGVSMAMPAAQNVSVSSVVANEIGKASSLFSMLGQLGGVFGIAALVAVFARIGSYDSPQTFSNGFVPAIGVSAALSLVGAIAGLILPGRGARTIIQTQAKAPETGKRESFDALEQSPSL